MKSEDLKCPWNCGGEFEFVHDQAHLTNPGHRIEHKCKRIETTGFYDLICTPNFKTRQGAMKNWMSFKSKKNK